jgi:excisionase family DNA binding protein
MDKLLTPQEMADCLGVKVSTIYQWTHQAYIPHIKMGKLVRFREKDVLEWMDQKSVIGKKSRRVDIREFLSQEHKYTGHFAKIHSPNS